MKRATRAQWAERVRRWRASGLSAPVFARRAGFHPGTLRWWASRLRSTHKTAAKFVEVVVAPPAAGRVEVVVRDGVVIRVSGAFDAEVLRRAVAALEVR